jgi:hypothetical protein
MRRCLYVLPVLMILLVVPGCRQAGLIAQGGDFALTVEQLRFEVTKLGPSFGFDDTFEGRRELVLNLAARNYLADEAERRGYGGEDLKEVVSRAETQAVGETYYSWKVDKAILLPRIKTLPWTVKLDRKLHLKDFTFFVYPVAEEALNDLRSGAPVENLEQNARERDDIHAIDMGWMLWKDLPRKVAEVVFRLDAGEATDVFSAIDGYHIFVLVEDEPANLATELMAVRSKRFVEAMEKEKLEARLEKELASRYDVRFDEQGLSNGLKAFTVAFAGGRPSDELMDGAILRYSLGELSVGDVFSAYFALPNADRPYVGDYHGLSSFSLQMILPDLEALAGHEMGIDRTRDVRFAARKAREDVLIPFMEDYFRSNIDVTDEDIAEYYDNRKSDLFEPGRYHVARIVVDNIEEARRARREIMMGTDFGDAAMRLSKDERSAPYGGDLGWITEGLVAPYDSVLAGVEPGGVTPPFATLEGVEILKLVERVDRRPLTLEEAAPSIRVFITNTKANEGLQAFVAAKEKEVGFSIDENLLREVDLPQPAYRREGARRAPDENDEGVSPLPKTMGA